MVPTEAFELVVRAGEAERELVLRSAGILILDRKFSDAVQEGEGSSVTRPSGELWSVVDNVAEGSN